MLETTLREGDTRQKTNSAMTVNSTAWVAAILAENRDSAVLGRPVLSGVTSHLRHSSAPSDGCFAASADRPLSAIGGVRQKSDTI